MDLILLTTARQPTAEVLPALGLLPHRVTVLPLDASALVDRVRYTYVDRGEAALPVPRTVGGPNGAPWTTTFEAALVRLISHYPGNPFSGYLEDAGIVIQD